MSKTALYRHYDAEGQLLYVGVSKNPLRRNAQHASGADWMESVCNTHTEWFASRRLAETAERVAIDCEKPLHNIARPLGPVPIIPVDGWRGAILQAIQSSGKTMRSVSSDAGLGKGYVHSVLIGGKEPTLDRFLSVCAAIPVEPEIIIARRSVSASADNQERSAS